MEYPIPVSSLPSPNSGRERSYVSWYVKLWSGVPREWAQHWVDENEMQTLTTAMGPLMVTKHPSCAKGRKTRKEWSRYVQGASGLFADQMPKGHVVTVLSRPPPQKLHPQGLSTYQTIEEPVLKGTVGGATVSRIEMVHPTVVGAEAYRHQVWPVDETNQWVEKYGVSPLKKHQGKGTKRYYFEFGGSLLLKAYWLAKSKSKSEPKTRRHARTRKAFIPPTTESL